MSLFKIKLQNSSLNFFKGMFQRYCLHFQNIYFPYIFERLLLCIPFCGKTSLVGLIFTKITLAQPVRSVMMMMMMIMMMINCFCGMVDQQKVFSLISVVGIRATWHILSKSQGKFFLSFLCTLFLHIFDT